MDIKKEREAFESWWEGFHNGRQIACDYVEEDNSYSVGYANAQWVAWQAKAQAVPEGFVVVPKVPTQKMLDATINVPIPAVYVDSISGQHKLKVAAYYKAMIVAWESANE